MHHADKAKGEKSLVVAKTDSRVLKGKNTIRHEEITCSSVCSAGHLCPTASFRETLLTPEILAR